MRIFKTCFLILFFAVTSCKNFDQQSLDDSNQLALEEGVMKGIPILQNNNGIIDDFSGDINMWWVANDKLVKERIGDTLRMKLKDCGAKYECWGKEFTASDFTEAPVAKVRARYEGNLAPTLRVSFKDANAYDANFNPPSLRLKKGGFQDYYFNFEGKWKQGWPDTREVDPTTIREILMFVNPGAGNWTGTLYIDDIRMVKVSDIPAKKPRAEVPKDTVKVNPNNNVNPVAISPVLIDNLSENNNAWWAGSDKIKLSLESDFLKVDFKEVGPGYETFGRSFPTINFTKTPVVKVRMKASGEKPIVIRCDIKDVNGFATNAKPVAMKFEPGTDFVDYYYDFTSKYEQTFPNVQTVDPNSIVEVIFFANPGKEPFTGTLFIDEISAISLEDFQNKK